MQILGELEYRNTSTGPRVEFLSLAQRPDQTNSSLVLSSYTSLSPPQAASINKSTSRRDEHPHLQCPTLFSGLYSRTCTHWPSPAYPAGFATSTAIFSRLAFSCSQSAFSAFFIRGLRVVPCPRVPDAPPPDAPPRPAPVPREPRPRPPRPRLTVPSALCETLARVLGACLEKVGKEREFWGEGFGECKEGMR